MRVSRYVLAILIFTSISAMAFAEIELGVGFSPPLQAQEQNAGMKGNIVEDAMYSFHGGFSFWWLFYAAVDSYVLPPYIVQNLTTTYDAAKGTIPGYYRPGFLTMIDVGIRPQIGPVILLLTTGINNLYIWKQDDIAGLKDSPAIGANLRAGAGLDLGLLSVVATGMVVFDDFQAILDLARTLAGGSEYLRTEALKGLWQKMYPTVTVNLHF